MQGLDLAILLRDVQIIKLFSSSPALHEQDKAQPSHHQDG